MSNKYKYLNKFIGIEPNRGNWFGKVSANEVKDAESLIGFEFPKSLKEFWIEIGSGPLRLNINNISGPDNEILSPDMVADIILRNEDSLILHYILDDYLKSGDIPFFHIGDSSSYLIMKKNAKYPNGVYDMCGNLLEKEFEEFIWKLYHESAEYYFDIILQDEN